MAPPPTLGSEVSLAAVALLDLLKKATGWVYCRFCYHLGSRCTCMGAFPPSWSQVVGESLGHGATASSGGLTTPGMPATGRLGRLAQQMPAPPTTTPCMPQTMPVQQPCLERPATPYQQAVQPPKRPAGGELLLTPLQVKLPLGGTTQDCRRPAVRGRGHGSCSVSHPRGVPEMVSVQLQHQEGGLPSGSMPSGSLPPPPPPPVPERTQPQRRGQTRSALRDPVRLGANFRISGWKKDLEHILKVYYKYSVDYFTEGDCPGSRNGSSTSSSNTRRKPWRSRRPIHWTLWPTSRTSSTRPPASIWMASEASPGGSRGGATIMG